jgi:hypothetical protein
MVILAVSCAVENSLIKKEREERTQGLTTQKTVKFSMLKVWKN